MVFKLANPLLELSANHGVHAEKQAHDFRQVRLWAMAHATLVDWPPPFSVTDNLQHHPSYCFLAT